MNRRIAGRRGSRRLPVTAAVIVGLAAAAVVVPSAPALAASPTLTASPAATTNIVPAAADAAAEEQVLTWTAGNSTDEYVSAPETAVAGPATIVFENSTATGNTFGMSHTLTFDTSTEGYNHDVDVDILASPFDANGGRYEVEVELTPGTYRYHCVIPGHLAMEGELVVTGEGGGEEDTTAPTVSADISGEQDADGAYMGVASITLAASDDDSGVGTVEYDLDGAGWTEYTEPLDVDAVGAHTLAYRATDAAGNVSEAQTAEFSVVEGDVVEDTTPPTVTPMVMGQQNADGAYIGSAGFMLTAEDEGSGVDTIEYDTGDGWVPYTGTVEFGEAGEHTVSFRATDKTGNVSEVGESVFTVVTDPGEEDTAAPVAAAEITGDQDENGAFVGAATATLTATDDASGVELVEYDLDGAGWAEYTEPLVVDTVGEHELVYRATDAAGNVADEAVTSFTVAEAGADDTTAPEVEADVSGEQGEDGAYLGSASVALTASDGGSGVASVEYDLDGSGWSEYSEAVVVDEPGEHTVAYRATDEAGNVSEQASVTITVVAGDQGDTVAPEVAHKVYGARNSEGEYIGNAAIRLNATDDDSGVETVEYQIDGSAWYRYATQISVRTPGEHTVSYRATDAAGNVSAPESFTVTIESTTPADDVAPVVTAGVSGSRDRNGAFMGKASVTLTATDEGSGIEQIEFQIDDGAWQRYAAPVVVAADGVHTVQYRATDGAGNVSRTDGAVFTVIAISRDRCPGSDVRPTVVIDGNDSTVANIDDGEGCTINDHIDEGADYANYLAFQRHVKQVTRELVQEKVLKRPERQRIIAAAEMAGIGR